MSGFPLRFRRSVLGPKLIDSNPIENPETDIPASAFEALFQQLVGLNLAQWTRAVVIANWNGSSFDYAYRDEAWNTDGQQTRPVLARAGAGNYSWTFASSYLDEDGNAQATVLVAPRASSRKLLTAASDRVDGYAWIDPAAPLVVQARFYRKTTDALEDVPFILEAG